MNDTALGEILIQLDVISPKQLAEALHLKECTPMPIALGEVLVGMGYCRKEDVLRALVLQPGLRSKNLRDRALATADIASSKKRTQAQQNRQLVRTGRALVRKMGDSLTPTPVLGIELPKFKR
jgi:hypothetical protein